MTVALGLAACAALAIALRAPLAATVLGLIAFGALHNVLELRYVAGRFAHVLRGRLLWTVCGFITGVVVCRLLGLRSLEILLGYLVLAAGIWFALPTAGRARAETTRPFGRPWRAGSRGTTLAAMRHGIWRWPALAALAGLAAVSLSWPAYHFVILAHLHNIVPLFFLWEWSRRLPDPVPFRAVQVGWVLAIPALILAGAFDPWISDGAGAVVAFAGEPAAIAAPVTPPHVAGMRFLVVFAFLQTMHYVVWVGFLPAVAPKVGLSGAKAWALGIGAAVLMGVLFLIDYAQGRTFYQAFAAYHAYLEFPVLIALLFAGSGYSPGREVRGDHRSVARAGPGAG